MKLTLQHYRLIHIIYCILTISILLIHREELGYIYVIFNCMSFIILGIYLTYASHKNKKIDYTKYKF